MSTDWAVTVTFQGTPEPEMLVALEDQLEEFGGSVGAVPGRGQYAVTITLDAGDWDKAVALVMDAVGPALRRIGAPDHVLGVEVLLREEYDRRADEPTMPELVSATEAADVLDVTRQRVHQLAASHPLFPEPILRLGTGPLWAAAAIQRFERVWDRKPGRRPQAARINASGRSSPPEMRTPARKNETLAS